MAVGKYDTHVKPKLLLIEAWARDGLTDEMICENLGISVASFHNYKRDHVEFLEALKKGKEIIDVMVENALLKAALGYEFEEVTTEYTNLASGENVIPVEVTKKVAKHAAPNTTALIFWLKNRRPTAWRDKQEIDHSGKLGLDVDIERMNDNEILDGIKESLQAINALSARIGTQA
ncbi:transposase [Paenibacillus sp. L3-i20]|uniref:transposase n=1 Tax=Paenibacillus sp. L3-i20 TaxID=2905833 RepID=UPI001EE0795F|nr:transposase [Paenibacillus sp. L3-i20]GKU76852.1 transposase [Paenibacillus sp. L3-i20]